MRISDWSSDVCASDLVDARELFAERTGALPVMVVARMMQPVAEHAARQPRHHRKIAIRLAAFVPLAIERLPVRITADIRRRLAGYGMRARPAQRVIAEDVSFHRKAEDRKSVG